MKTKLLFFFLLISSILSAQEICDNGIDDDGDGLIDLNDDECQCATTSVNSIIPNPSFEVHSSCPTNFSIPGNDQLSLATPWIQATSATSDYFNTCGYILPGVVSSGLNTFPDGNAIVGAGFLSDWKEYIGTPLLSPMLSGTNYQLTFNIASLAINPTGGYLPGVISNYEPINITLYGCTDGSNLPLNTVFSPNISDPTWKIIGHVTYSPLTDWEQVTMTFTPTIDINAIMIGAPAVLPNSYTLDQTIFPYFVFDNLLLNEASEFGVNISQSGSFCENNLILNANITTNTSSAVTYQWYHEGIAIIGATSSTFNIPSFTSNLGHYSVKISDGSTCYISTEAIINRILSSPNYAVVQPNCLVPSGTITITTPALEYSFDNGITWQSSPIKNSLPVGNYFIKIKTPNGCISSGTGVTIQQPQLISSANLSVTQPTSCDETGTITINSSIASEYSFDGGITWTTNSVANNLQPGNYIVLIKDQNGCQSANQFITINRVFLSQPTVTIIQPSCDNSGEITITTTADEYSFDDGTTWSNSPTLSNLPAGSYYVKIRNNNGCESYSQFVNLQPFYLNESIDYTIIDPSCGLGGTITIHNTATEYSFDGGITWTTSNAESNLSPGYYEILIRNNINCTSYPVNVFLRNFYLPNPEYTVVQPDCDTEGSITITTIAAEYSFDGGNTWTTNPVATNLNSGTYNIVIKNDLNCISNSLYVNLNYFNLPAPLYTVSNSICGANGTITITTVANEYSFDNGATWTTNPIATNLSPGYYIIKIRNSPTCESYYTYVNLRDFNSIYPEYTYTNAGCDTYATITITTPADLYSFDGGNTWTSNNTITNLLGGQAYYIKAKMNNGCVSNTNSVYINSTYLSLPDAHDYHVTTCDNLNDGSENINLSSYNDNLIANAIDFSFTYYTTYLGATNQTIGSLITNSNAHNLSNTNNTVYVRVTSSQNCSKVVTLTFSFIDSPVITMNDSYILCENSTVTINAENGFDSYLWSTGETTESIVVDQAGNYTLTVTENHGALTCSSTKELEVVLSNPATITSFNTEDWTVENNIISVNVTGLGNYEYSLDGIVYQDSNTFYDLETGEFTIYVRDKNECGEVSGEIYLLMYPKFFTPNGDGYNDFWQIKFSDNEPNMIVSIFDRQGKFIKQFGSSSQGWDGNYLGKQLPSTDYWFVVTRENGKEFKGHFTLKR
ncbi:MULTISPECIES: T9SS type B sorting domain-containing protein [Flavobacterium]|uniref:T9SS type B sorting domain-containing protein n=1 Tax=Flavobacterium jumunjinense TaxID=998845 RepID=A0ABV5GKP5_9FLAO|nr:MULTISPECIES: T9SS type B sorting domain-containing protein [Flavobacterium]